MDQPRKEGPRSRVRQGCAARFETKTDISVRRTFLLTPIGSLGVWRTRCVTAGTIAVDNTTAVSCRKSSHNQEPWDERFGVLLPLPARNPPLKDSPNLPTNIVDFRGFDSSTILNMRGGVPRPIGDFPESLSQAMLVGIMILFVRRLHSASNSSLSVTVMFMSRRPLTL